MKTYEQIVESISNMKLPEFLVKLQSPLLTVDGFIKSSERIGYKKIPCVLSYSALDKNETIYVETQAFDTEGNPISHEELARLISGEKYRTGNLVD